MTFAEFYADYPRKVGKKDAEKAWKTLKVTQLIGDKIHALLEKRKREDWKGRDVKFIPYPAHFLRSEGFDDDVEVHVKAEQTIPVLGAEHHHVCEFCDVDHEWLCQDELCTLGPKVACPIIRGKYKASK